jgi:hypothetical protein
MPPLTRPGLEALLIRLIALHSLAIGAVLLFATEWGLRFGGFGRADPLFFPRQAGAFHLVVALGYLLEHRRCRGVSLLVVAKSTAVVFLGGAMLLGPVPWSLPLAAAGDAGMLLAVLVLRRTASTPPEA